MKRFDKVLVQDKNKKNDVIATIEAIDRVNGTLLLKTDNEEWQEDEYNCIFLDETRQIDITKQDIRYYDAIYCEYKKMSVEYELWFDVDKYFGTHTREFDMTWINFYTYWDSETNDIEAYVSIDSDMYCVGYDWPLTDEEKEFFRKKMTEYCGKDLKEYWEEWCE